MDTKTFTNQLSEITEALLAMTPAQREVVHQSIQASRAEIAIDELIQPMFDHLSQCPHCHSDHFKKWGKAKEVQRYYCNSCHKTFNNRTKTPLAKLHKSHLWVKYARCMELKLTLREAASVCHINLKTAFLWRHRFLSAQSNRYGDKLSGIIEVDEFFLAYSEKGAKKLSSGRKPRKRGGNIDKRTKAGQVPVLLSIDRSNHMIDGVLSADTELEIQRHLEPYVVKDSVLCSDGSWAYANIANSAGSDHKRLVSGKDRVIDKIYHIQTVNGMIAHFKGWVDGKMRGVATKYLTHYLAWFREGYANHSSQQILQSAYG